MSWAFHRRTSKALERTKGDTFEQQMNDYEFKMGVLLADTALPFEEAVGIAQELGARFVEYSVPEDKLTDEHADYRKRILDDAGLHTHAVGCSPPNPFKKLHIDEVELAELGAYPEFKRDLDNIRRSMAFAKIVEAPQVQCSGFAWPGEFRTGKRPGPTWSKRYAAGGGFIPPAELEKIVQAFRWVADLADEHDIDVLLSVHPWEYVNTSRHYLEIVEQIDSTRFKAKWCPGDAILSGEFDTVTTGFENLKPYLTSLHLKDTRTIDGPSCKFEWCELGTGDPDYAALFRSFARDRTDVVIAAASHYEPPGGKPADGLRINYQKALVLAEQAVASA